MEDKVVDPGFLVTETAVTVVASKASSGIHFDPGYINIRNIPAILKVAQMVFDILGYIIMMCSPTYGAFANWFSFVSMTGFNVTTVLLIMYVLHAVERLHMVPWLKLEFGYCALWTFFYLTASLASACYGGYSALNAVAAVFGFVAMILYGVDAFFKFKGWKRGDLAQGERPVQTATDPEILSPGAY